MSDKGHIEITVGSEVTPLVIDPQSYQVVDIVDFAPQAVSGSPAFSELGLYLDVAQDGFGHGFGQWRFGEPKSYAYTGNLVDTRHGNITLFTNPGTSVKPSTFTTNNPDNTYIYTQKFSPLRSLGGVGVPCYHSGREKYDKSYGTGHAGFFLGSDFTSASDWLVLHSTAWAASLGVTGNIWYAKVWPAGKYFYITQPSNGRMKLAGIAKVASNTTSVLTFDAAVAFESTNLWAGGYVSLLGVVQQAIASSTANTITVSGTPYSGSNDQAGKLALFWVPTGVAGNPPNGFDQVIVFGGHFWSYEHNTNFLHYWSEITGSDAEGGGTTDLGCIKVGPPGQPIVNMAVFNNQLWVFRPDGAWVVGEDKVAYHTLNFAEEAHPDNFKVVTPWNGFLYFSVRNKLFKFRSGLQDITPPPFTEAFPQTQFGNFQGLAPRGSFLYVTATSSAAFSDETSETGNFVVVLAYDGVGWHKIAYKTNETMGVSGHGVGFDPTNDYMYTWAYVPASSDYTMEVHRHQLQTYSDLPYAAFPTSGEHNLYTSYYDLGMKRIPKSWASVSLEGYFPTNTSVNVEFRVDSTTTWTDLGTAFTSNLQEIAFPAGTEGKRIQLRLDLKTTSAASTPVVQSVILKCMMRPDVLYGVSCHVVVSDDVSDANGLVMGLTAAQIKTALEAARASVSPITLKDIQGNSASAYLSSLQFFLTEYEHRDKVELTAKCTFVYV